MQERFKKSIDFNQTQWLNWDPSTQRGGVRSGSWKGDKTFIQ